MFEKLKEGAATAAADKAQAALREFNDTLPVLKTLGLSVCDVSFKMGLPPEIAASLVGSMAALDPDKIRELSEKHRENKTVGALLEALRTAASLRDQMAGLGFRGIRVDIKLGILPHVDIGLLAEPAAAQAAPAAAVLAPPVA